MHRNRTNPDMPEHEAASLPAGLQVEAGGSMAAGPSSAANSGAKQRGSVSMLDMAAKYILLPAEQRRGEDFLDYSSRRGLSHQKVHYATMLFGTDALWLSEMYSPRPPAAGALAALAWHDLPGAARQNMKMSMFAEQRGVSRQCMSMYVNAKGVLTKEWSEPVKDAFRSILGGSYPRASQPGATSHPMWLDHPQHPDSRLYSEIRGQLGEPYSGEHGDRLAALLTVAARRNGMERIDQIVPGDHDNTVWGVQRAFAHGYPLDKHCMVPLDMEVSMKQIAAEWPEAMRQFEWFEQRRLQLSQVQQLNHAAPGPSLR